MPQKKTTYEELKQKLQDTIDKLSDEELTLDEMMKLYNEGNRYAKKCQEILASYKTALTESMKPDEEDEEGEGYALEDSRL